MNQRYMLHDDTVKTILENLDYRANTLGLSFGEDDEVVGALRCAAGTLRAQNPRLPDPKRVK